jgi:hypothetical protein
VRYESLVADPGRELKRICTAYDLSYRPEVLEYHLRPDAIEAAKLSPLWTNLAKPIQHTNVEKFRNPQHREYIEQLEEAAFDDMMFFGYTPTYATRQAQYSPDLREEIQATDASLRAAAKASANSALEEIHQRRNDVLTSLLDSSD